MRTRTFMCITARSSGGRSPVAPGGEGRPRAVHGPGALRHGGDNARAWVAPRSRCGTRRGISVAGRPRDVYYIKAALPPTVKAILPASVNPPFTEDAYRDVPPSTKRPFPLVLFSHGFAGIVSSRPSSRPTSAVGLRRRRTGVPLPGPRFGARGEAREPADRRPGCCRDGAAAPGRQREPGSLLSGTVKKRKLAVTGHSPAAHGDPVRRAVRRRHLHPALRGRRRRAGSGPHPAGHTSLYTLGGDDQVVSSAKVVRFWKQKVKVPKRLVVIAGAGHPTDRPLRHRQRRACRGASTGHQRPSPRASGRS